MNNQIALLFLMRIVLLASENYDDVRYLVNLVYTSPHKQCLVARAIYMTGMNSKHHLVLKPNWYWRWNSAHKQVFEYILHNDVSPEILRLCWLISRPPRPVAYLLLDLQRYEHKQLPRLLNAFNCFVSAKKESQSPLLEENYGDLELLAIIIAFITHDNTIYQSDTFYWYIKQQNNNSIWAFQDNRLKKCYLIILQSVLCGNPVLLKKYRKDFFYLDKTDDHEFFISSIKCGIYCGCSSTWKLGQQ
jgi:hypothetical protein